MKNLMNLKGTKILSEVEQKSINGDLMSIEPVSCTAYCGEKVSVTCTGVGCMATDYDGCTG